jgi:hypothetical protein
MRTSIVIVLVITISAAVAAQAPKAAPGERYGLSPTTDVYPQGTPQETLGSVVKAIGDNRVDYLMAQLADPDYVDQRVQHVHHGKFQNLVEEATQKLTRDPIVIKTFRRFLNEGTWDAQEAKASVRLKDRADQAGFRRIGERWFMENWQRPPAETKEK